MNVKQFKKEVDVKYSQMFILKNVSRFEGYTETIYENESRYELSNITGKMEYINYSRVKSIENKLRQIVSEELVPFSYGDIIKAGDETQLVVKGSIEIGHGADNVITYAGIRNFEYVEWYANADRVYSVNLSVGSAVDSNVTTAIKDLNMSNTTSFLNC